MWERVRINEHTVVLLHQISGVLQDSQGAQSQQVHLEQANALDIIHGNLRTDFFFTGTLQWNQPF